MILLFSAHSPSNPEMTDVGPGVCTLDAYISFDDDELGRSSLYECKRACLADQKCWYTAFAEGITCSRYTTERGHDCPINPSQDMFEVSRKGM